MNNSLHIGIDARMFGPRVGGGGPGRYTQELVLALQKLDLNNRYTVFCKRDNFGDIPIPNARWTKTLADVHWYTLAEQTRLPRILDRVQCDLIHIPHFNVPLRLRTPFIATVHDLIMLEQPWSARASTRSRSVFELKRAGFRLTLNHVARHARAIITVSNHARNQIIHTLRMSPERVHVVYNGVDSDATSAAPTQTPTDGSVLRTRVRPPFLLNVGNSYPHKNIETLLHAFSFLLADHPDVQLVLAGPDNVFQQRLRAEAREIAIPDDRLFFAGFVSDDDLRWLYAHAAAYVLPSKLEGFGIPPLEALRFGTPVAASRASCIPEILGDAAVYFDPDDLESMVGAVESLLDDPSARTRTLAHAPALLARYRWDRAAQQVLDIYHATAKQNAPQSHRARSH